MIVRITEIKYKKPEEFNPNGIWFSEIRSVVRAMDYYELDNEFQTRINYRLILIIWYINFFLIVTIWIILPSTTKESCGNGLQWKSHFMMAGFLFANFVVEISLFFIAIPRDLLLKILISAKGDLRDNAWNIWATFLAIVINGWFLVSGIISKLSIYTDVSFSMEALSCGHVEIWGLSFLLLLISLSYNAYSFISLFFHIDRK